jgi:Asp/Glu/hydantoin racemase
LGVLLLDANALTVPGAVSHPDSFGQPTVLHTVEGATAAAITAVQDTADTLEARYSQAAAALAERGAGALTTNCGFTLPFQGVLQQRTGLPVVSSALLLLPVLRDVYGSDVGVLTYDSDVLITLLERSWDEHVLDTPHADVRGCAAWQALSGEPGTALDTTAMRAELVATAETFAQRHGLRALLLECTGFAPFADAMRTHLDIPVFDHVTIVRFLLGTPLPATGNSNQARMGGMNR